MEKKLDYRHTAGSGNRSVRVPKEKAVEWNNTPITKAEIEEFMRRNSRLHCAKVDVTLSARRTSRTWGTAWISRCQGQVVLGGRMTLYRHSRWVFLHELAHLMGNPGHGVPFGRELTRLCKEWEEIMTPGMPSREAAPRPTPAKPKTRRNKALELILSTKDDGTMRKTAKITSGDKWMLEWLTDRLHVGQSDLAVIRHIVAKLGGFKLYRSRLTKGARKLVLVTALNRHHANQGLYHKVMTGRI